jgi:polypeptide N-acetylgalactosaminyltransferase
MKNEYFGGHINFETDVFIPMKKIVLKCSGWLEPLLDRIAANKTNVVCPVIDVIEDESLRYQYGSAKATSIGGFDWNLQFTWHGIPEYERQRRGSDIAPVR